MYRLLALVIGLGALASCATLPPNLTGDWEIESSVGGTIPITVNCSLVQTGNALSGTCTPVMENPESAEIIGSVAGSTASWGYDVVFNGNPGTVEFTAESISNSEIAGELMLSGSPAPFTASRK
jgi:hypothetical protein